MLQLRIESFIAVFILSFCVAIAVDPVRVANFLYRRPIAKQGDLFFILAYRLIAIVGALIALYILIVDLRALLHG